MWRIFFTAICLLIFMITPASTQGRKILYVPIDNLNFDTTQEKFYGGGFLCGEYFLRRFVC